MSRDPRPSIRGRGVTLNPPNRFERICVVPDPGDPAEDQSVSTEFYRDPSRMILSRNDSPDIGFEFSLNPYRGCEHGCAYCYARPTHEYLGFSSGLDFETRILVKENAPTLLRNALMSRSWKPQPIALSGATDPYQPAEKHLRITRRCLEILRDFRNPVTITTKNHLITRDIDLLRKMARFNLVAAGVSVTSLNPRLQRKLEPRASSPQKRLLALRELSQAGIPTRVLVAPVIPGLNDFEVPLILEQAARHGTASAGYILLRLPHSLKELFESWLQDSVPERAGRVLNRIRETRGGRLNDPEFCTRMVGEGPYAGQISRLFEVTCRKLGLSEEHLQLSTDRFRRPTAQGKLFEL